MHGDTLCWCACGWMETYLYSGIPGAGRFELDYNWRCKQQPTTTRARKTWSTRGTSPLRIHDVPSRCLVPWMASRVLSTCPEFSWPVRLRSQLSSDTECPLCWYVEPFCKGRRCIYITCHLTIRDTSAVNNPWQGVDGGGRRPLRQLHALTTMHPWLQCQLEQQQPQLQITTTTTGFAVMQKL